MSKYYWVMAVPGMPMPGREGVKVLMVMEKDEYGQWWRFGSDCAEWDEPQVVVEIARPS